MSAAQNAAVQKRHSPAKLGLGEAEHAVDQVPEVVVEFGVVLDSQVGPAEVGVG